MQGGLRPHSDIDVLAVVRSRTTAALRRALVDGLLTLSGSGAAGGARPVELTVVVASDVRPWRYPPLCEFQYGEWLREEYERGETPAPEPDPDLGPVRSIFAGPRRLARTPPATAGRCPLPRCRSRPSTSSTRTILRLAIARTRRRGLIREDRPDRTSPC
ncbi:hypothetical protein ACWEJP_00380 [Streptomyces sp. NPDC004749]